ncbi:hypothetical protein [Pelagicoccus sp. SDUM812003]|uniref:hypothetical protein n=1 Tax=Pelagicoccus sp. SDUM812003 TaxID=3041267 RepID=UPI00280F850F|nr:hypothetical protein [Pelagicoccus sp. SDUM812003]MDQ8201821.1 hypothetical protein [Pelagicoccus sp. SDUM812003]
MIRSFLLAILLASTVFLTSCGGEKPFSPEGLGPLEDVIQTGDDGAWSVTRTDGIHWLENRQDSGSIQYYFSNYVEDQAGKRTVMALVNPAEADSNARAGILYGYQDSPKSYYAIVVGPDSVLEIYRRDQDGFGLTQSSSFEPAESGFQKITVSENDSTIRVSVNGRDLASMQSDQLGRGALGIVAMGTGRFGFTNYRETGTNNLSSVSPKKVDSVEETRTSVSTPQSPAMRFKDQPVLDVSRNRVPAYFVFVPDGWKQEGKFEQFQAYHNVPYFGSIDVKAPDGRAFSYLPLLEFIYTDFAQLPFMQPYEGRPAFRQPTSLGEIMLSIVQANPQSPISNVQIVSEEPAPELIEMARRNARPILQQIEIDNRQAGQFGERQTYQIDARKLVLRYEENGKQIESTNFATITNYAFVQPNGATRIAKWNILNAIALAGPVGSDYLNDPQLAAVARSVRMNPDWAYAIDQWNQGVRQLAIQEGMAKAAAARQGWQNTAATQGEDVLDISFNGWKSRNASSDRMQSLEVNSIHERTTYSTPSGSTVNLPSYYQNAYTDGQGNYVLHNDALYDINTDPNFNSRDWSRIEEVQ